MPGRRLAAGSMLVLAAAVAAVAPLAPARAATAERPVEARGWVVERVRFEPAGQLPLHVDGRAYRGAIEVGDPDHAGPSAGLAVLDELPLEDYVAGISEVPASWPPAAQEAQAIAARTYAMHSLLRTRHFAIAKPLGADICATQSCQVYAGMASEQRTHGQRWLAAVRATEGQLLLWNGGPILAQYSSTNGGRTVRGSRPYLWEVDDPDDAVSPYHRWRVDFPIDGTNGIRSLFSLAGPLVTVARQGDTITLTARQPDGLEYPLQMSAAHFRAEVNRVFPASPGLPRAIPSTRFALAFDATGDRLVIDGGGWGHGIGMSQYGALGKARRGMAAADILAAYYGGIRPTYVEPDRIPPTIRVLLAEGRSKVTVAGDGTFHVRDQSGQPLVTLGTGVWTIEPTGDGRVRVVPPPGYEQPLQGATLDPPTPRPGQAPTVRFALVAPATVRVTLGRPEGTEATVAEGELAPGEHAVPLPLQQPAEGPWRVVVHATSGVDRVTVVPIDFTVEVARPVVRQARRTLAARTTGAGTPAPATTAVAAALIVLVAGAHMGRLATTRR